MASSGWPAGYSRPLKPIRYKFLSSLNLGGNEIRFLGVNEANNAVHFPTTVNDCPGRLLFLASDVLAGTQVARKNHIRVHSRYSKNGYATKLRLTGFKIEGINNSGTMWFYSIQGLFHVMFELHNIATQKDCLLSLQDLWLARYEDPLLQPEGTVRFNLRLRINSQTQSGEEIPSSSGEPDTGRTAQPVHITCPSKVVVIDEVDAMLRAASYLEEKWQSSDSDATQDQSCQADDGECPGPGNQGQNIRHHRPDTGQPGPDIHHHRPDTGQPGPEVDLDDVDVEEVDVETVDAEELRAGDFVQRLIRFVRSSISSVNDISHQVIMQILMTLDYLKHISNQEEEHFHDWGLAFFNMMEEYLLLIRQDTSDPSFDNTFGLPREKYILLYVVGDWLGREFHKLESQVAQKVEIFKKRNIDALDNLPRSETTIDMLFPLCMKKMLVNWLGGPKEDSTSLDWLTSVAFSDHSYIPPPKCRRKGELGHPNYALVQLILEFASNCLISGMAHVVFSRLQVENTHDQCVCVHKIC